MPILYFVACISFSIFLFVDTWLFTRFYHKPPHVDGSLAELTCVLLPYAIFMHLSFSLWAFSNESIFPITDEPDDTYSRVSQSRNYPTLAVWAIVLIHLLLRDLFFPFISELTLVFPNLHCCLGRETIPWENNPR